MGRDEAECCDEGAEVKRDGVVDEALRIATTYLFFLNGLQENEMSTDRENGRGKRGKSDKRITEYIYLFLIKYSKCKTKNTATLQNISHL
jgi:hypothetical protein